MKKDEKQTLKRVLNNNLWVLKFVCKYSPFMIISKLIVIPISVLNSYISINMTRWILNMIDIYNELSTIIFVIISFSLFFIITNAVFALFNIIINPKLSILLGSSIREEVIEKIKVINQQDFQNPEFYNIYKLGLNEIDGRAISVLNSLTDIIISIISFFVITGVTASISEVFSVFGIVAAFINVSLGIIRQKINYKQTIDTTPDGRRRGYINRVTYQPEFSSDLKIYSGFTELLKYRYKKATVSVINIIIKYAKKIITIDQLQQIPSVVFRQTLPWIVISILLFNKSISISEATVLSSSALIVPGTLSSFLTGISSFHGHSLYIENLRKIFNYKVSIEKTEGVDLQADNMIQQIELKNTYFSYPSSAHCVLNNVNLNFNRGDKVALVGYNGAGKTSLAKLLVRLFDTTDGQILINGISISEYNINSLRNRIAYLSQDFKVYSFTIAENILMRSIKTKEDEDVVYEALKKVGLYDKVLTFKDGINTFITTEFEKDGVYFSGGELQKLALARIYAGDYDVIVLDESTSALDPVSEDEIINTIFSIFKEKTIIMISHRLAIINYVNRICFMSYGEIKESGTHKELIDNKKEYYNFYISQSRKYDHV